MLLSWLGGVLLAQQSGDHIVCVGDATNTSLPINGPGAHRYMRCQMLYPDTLLEGLIGETITQLKWYLSTATGAPTDCDFVVEVATTWQTELEDFDDVTSMRMVYAGGLVTSGTEIGFELTEPFVYEGGNLLVNIYNVTSSARGNELTFLGIERRGAGVSGSGQSSDYVWGSVIDFLPTTNFYCGNSCPRPLWVRAAVEREHGATIRWNSVGGATGYMVTAGGIRAFTTDTCYSFTGLLPNTEYGVEVRSHCGANDSSDEREATFHTRCGSVACVDENFESCGNMFPLCWRHKGDDVTLSTMQYPYRNSCIKMIGTDGVVVELPWLPATISDLEVVFDAVINEDGYIEVGYKTLGSESDAGAVHHVATVGRTGAGWQCYVVGLGHEPRVDSICVVFSTPRSGFFCEYNIDNVWVGEAQPCCMPYDLQIDSVCANGISFVWKDSTNTLWDVAYGLRGCDPDAAVVLTNVASRRAVIGGLRGGVLYDVFVRPHCGNSRWSQPLLAMAGGVVLGQMDTVRGCDYTVAALSEQEWPWMETRKDSIVLLPPNDSTTLGLRGNFYVSDNALRIYEGVGTEGRLLCSLNSPDSVNVVSQLGALTLCYVQEDYAITNNGFRLNVQCVSLPPCASVNNLQLPLVGQRSMLATWQGVGTHIDHYLVSVTNLATGQTVTDICWDESYRFEQLDFATPYRFEVRALCDNGDTSEALGREFVTEPSTCLRADTATIDTAGVGLERSLLDLVRYQTGNLVVQQVYNRYEMGAVRRIEGMRLRTEGGGRCVHIFLSHTNCADASSFHNEEPFTEVWSGRIPSTPDSLMDIAFDVPFGYNGKDNLLLTWIESMQEGVVSYASHDNGILFSCCKESPTDTFTVAQLPDTGSTTHYRWGVEWIGNPCDLLSTCESAVTQIESLDADEVALSWQPIAGNPYWSVDRRVGCSWLREVDSTDWNYVVFGGLDAYTDYTFRIVTHCSDNDSVGTYLTLRTPCGVVRSFPFAEDFDNAYQEESLYKNCWRSYPENVLSTLDFSTGDLVLRFRSYMLKRNVVVLPEMDSIGSLRLSCDLCANEDNHSYLRVGVMTDPDDMETFTEVQRIVSPLIGDFFRVEVSFCDYDGAGRYIAILSDSICDMDVDRVVVDRVQGCSHPVVLELLQNTSTTAVLSAHSVAARCEVEYGPVGYPLGGGVRQIARADSIPLAGLQPATDYVCYVRDVCDSDSFGDWSLPFRFSTLCAPISQLPYTENFDHCYATTLPVCWITDGATCPFIVHTLDRGGDGASLLFSLTHSIAASYAALPEFAHRLGDLNLSLSLNVTNSDGEGVLIVASSATLDDPSQFHTLHTIPLRYESENWNDYELSLSEAPEEDHYVVLLARAQLPQLLDLSIDNVEISLPGSCRAPDSLRCLEVHDTCATLAWYERGVATRWQVECRCGDDGSVRVVEASSNPFVLTGLQPLHHYSLRVRSYCSPNEYGSYSRYDYSFITTQTPATLPYLCDFEIPDEWNRWSTSSSMSPENWYRGSVDVAQGEYGLYVSVDSGATVSSYMLQLNPTTYVISTPNITAFRDIDFGPVDTNFVISFLFKHNSSYPNDYFGVLLVDPLVDVQSSQMIQMTPWGTFANLNPIATSNYNGGWTLRSFEIDHISGVHRLALFYSSNSSSNPVQIDSLVVRYCGCPRPNQITLDSVSTDWAALSWLGNPEVDYEVSCRLKHPIEPFTTLTTSTNHIVLNNLVAGAPYELVVRAICGPGELSNLSDTFYFHTDCPDVVEPRPSWLERFDYDLYCWQQQQQNGENYWQTVDFARNHFDDGIQYPYSGYRMAFSPHHYRGSHTLLISPPLSLLGEAYVSFAHRQSSSFGDLDTLGVFYRTDSLGEWLYMGSFSRPIESWKVDTLTIPHAAECYQIAFLAYDNFGNGVAIDSLVIHTRSSCHTPVWDSVFPSHSQCFVHWDGNADVYEVALRKVSDSLYTDSVTVNVAHYTFRNLEAETQYVARVRAVCGASVSPWVEQAFTTTEMRCFPPVGLRMDTIDYNFATLSWSPLDTLNDYRYVVLCYAADSVFDTIEGTIANLTSLFSATTYCVRIASQCDFYQFSDFSEPICFSTLVCAPVEEVRAEAVERSANVRLSWLSESADTFLVEYGLQGFGQGEGTQIQVIGNRCTIVGLDPETTYDIYVRSVCRQGVHSVWSQGVTITTGTPDVTCATVEGVAVEVNATSINASWSPVADAQGYEVEYGPQGFVHGTGVWHGSINAPSFSVSNLDSGDYQLYVRAFCGSGNYGSYSSAVPFSIASVGIDEEGRSQTIFPNPTTGEITVLLAEPLQQVIAINVVGQRKRLPLNGNRISLADCPQGIYILELHTLHTIYHRKILKR